MDAYSIADIDSCHTRRLRRIHVRELDPSMLIAFLIKDEEGWRKWRREIENTSGKAVIRIEDNDPALLGIGGERAGAISEVESFDDDDDDTILDA
jgi:cysteine protease ATG4